MSAYSWTTPVSYTHLDVYKRQLYVRGADMVSGTPIVDIKPYLAYADSYPDAAGGFTGGDAGAVLTVDFPPELLAQFDSGQRHGPVSYTHLHQRRTGVYHLLRKRPAGHAAQRQGVPCAGRGGTVMA